MGYLPIDYVQLQRSVSCSDSRCLKLVREIKVSKFSDFCNSFQSQAAENWNEMRPNEVLALGMISEIHLLDPGSWLLGNRQFTLDTSFRQEVEKKGAYP